jgi:SAM-dependent methyltransferase
MKDYYEALYNKNENYWGVLPSPVSLMAFQQVREGKALDLGCGQGPDALFFAKKGLVVTAIDISPKAIADLKRHAQESRLSIDAREGNMEHLPQEEFQLVFSRMALQMIAPNKRIEYIKQLKETYPDAVHCHIVPISGAAFGDAFIFEDALLKEAYAEWAVMFYEEAWTIARALNRDSEPYLMREARIIARR